MATIKDNKGRAFNLSLNVQSYKRVLSDTGIDLGLYKALGPSRLPGQPLSAELWESMSTLLDVLWSMVRPAAQKSQINRDDFDAGFFGPAFVTARQAFIEEWALFFRTLGREDDAQLIEMFLKAAPAEVAAMLKSLNEKVEAFSAIKSSNTPPSPELSEPTDSPSET